MPLATKKPKPPKDDLPPIPPPPAPDPIPGDYGWLGYPGNEVLEYAYHDYDD